MVYTKGYSKQGQYLSTGYIKWDGEVPIEYILKNEYDSASVEKKKYHVAEVKVVTNIENTTFYDVWQIDKHEISEKEYEEIKNKIDSI